VSQGLRKSAWMLAVVPITGLLLAGCGGSGGDTSGGEEPLGVETTAPSTSAGASSAESTERFDITVVMVCNTVQGVLDDVGTKAKPGQVKTALRKGLNAAFKDSTTPKSTIGNVKVDKMLNQGCPGLRAKALQRADVYDFTVENLG
jgi:hypothetical protein